MPSAPARLGFLGAAVICFAIAALAVVGVILAGDLVGRLVFGVVWVAVGVVWLGSYFGAFFGRRRRRRSGGAN
jgi:hypothetical protein